MNAPGTATPGGDALARRLAELRDRRLAPDWPGLVLAFARDLTLAEAGAVIGATASGLSVLAPAEAGTLPEGWAQAARAALETRAVVAREAGARAWLMAAPLDGASALVVLAPCASPVDRALTRERLALLSAFAEASGSAAAASALVPAAAAAEAARAKRSAGDEEAGLAAAAARLAALLPSGTRLALGLVRGGRVAALALSDQPAVNPRTELVRALALAMEEALDRGETLALPDASGTSAAARAFPKVLASPGCLVVPDRAAGACALVLWRDSPTASAEATAALLRPALALLGDGTRNSAARRRRARHLARLWPVAALTLLVGLAAVTPRPDEVVASFVAQPSVVHVVTAPFDGVLEASSVRPGDLVSEGEVLARLSTRELELELAAVRARAANDRREAAIARAAGQPAQEMIAELSARRSEAQRALLEHRLALAQIRAPASGAVLAGDLRRSLGQALARGQTLFEIAAPDDLRAELLLPEARAHLVRPGQRGWLSPAADPAARVPITIERVRPMAEVVQGRNVFRAIALLPEGHGDTPLRPGAEGVARVEVGETTWLAWAVGDAWMSMRRLLWM
jgi:multidrug resistance efflux pump